MFASAPSRPVVSNHRIRFLRLEPLEDRRMLSVGTLGSDLDGASNQTIEMFHAQDALFAENAGQWENAGVYFGYNKSGTQIYFTDESIEFGLSKQELKDGVDPAAVDELELGLPGEEEDLYETTFTHFSLNFDGAAATIPSGADRAETVFNYHLGAQEDWVDGVATYKIVMYNDLYDGIDLHTFSRHGEMKYEFHVAPGADWSDIQLSYDGIEGLSIAEDGSLQIQTELGTVVDEGLYIYQTIDGEQVEVAGEFTLLDADTYTFTVTGDYDPSVELVIDPEVEWESYLGDCPRGVATDASGNVYVAGCEGVDGGDAYVAALAPDGAHRWLTYLGGEDTDEAYAVTTDASGNVYVAGGTESAGWVSGGWKIEHRGGWDGYVVSLNPEGAHRWSTYLGGTGDDSAYAVTTDASGNVYAAGTTGSAGWVSGGWDPSHGGGYDGFVVSLTLGGAHHWSTFLGAANHERAYAITTDASGNVHAGGQTSSSGWISGGWDPSYGEGYYDGFIVSLNSSGAYRWSTYLGGDSPDYCWGISTDASGNIYAAGETESANWVLGGTQLGGDRDGFVVSLTSSGGYRWGTYLGGSADDSAYAIATDPLGNVYAVGETGSTDWVSGGWDSSYGEGSCDGFVVSLTHGGEHRWSSYVDGPAYAVSTDAPGGVCVAGNTESSGAFVMEVSDYTPGLTVQFSAPDTTEGVDGNPVSAWVQLAEVMTRDITVLLQSDDETELLVPDSVVVPAGQQTAYFDVEIIDDQELDGTQTARIWAYIPGSESEDDAILHIFDNEKANLYLELPTTTATEGDDPLTATIRLDGSITTDLVVNVTSSDETAATVPLTVTVPAGMLEYEFPIEIVDDGAIDSLQTTEISVTADGWNGADASLDVEDNETRVLDFTIDLEGSFVTEGDPAFSGTIEIDGTYHSDFDVMLTSSDTSEVTVPEKVTILQGQTSVDFEITIEDDDIADGTQNVELSAWAPDWTSPEPIPLSVQDNEVAIPGDLNGDGYVGSFDLDIVRLWWNQTVPPGSLIQGDPSGDGMVGSADLDIVRANWGAGTPAAAASGSKSTEIPIGGEVEGHFEGMGDMNVYQVQVGAGEHLTIQLDGHTYGTNDLFVRYGTVPTLEVYDYKGTGSGMDKQADVPSTQAGTYYVLVHASALGLPRDYTMRADVTSTLDTIPVGGEIDGDFDEMGDIHVYQVHVGEGEHLTVQLDGHTYGTNTLFVRYGTVPSLDVYDYEGTGSGMDKQVDVPSTQAGTYYVLVHASALGLPRDYTMRADVTSTLDTIPVGGEIDGDFDEMGDVHVYQVHVGEGEHLTVELDGHTYGTNQMFVAYGTVPSPDVYDYEGTGSGMDKLVDIPSTQAGMYYVWVHASALDLARDYTMRADVLAARLPGDLKVDGTVGSADLDIVRGNWGTTVSPGVLLRGDPSGDGTVGSADLDIIRGNWGAAATVAAARTDSETSTPAAPLHGRLRAAFDAALEHWGAARQARHAARETRDAARETWAEALNALHVRESRKDKTTSRHAAADAAVLAWME